MEFRGGKLKSVRLPFRRPTGITWLVAAALILVPVLAVFQYRWIGQVSDAERERHERTLRHSTSALTDDLDIELIRAFIGLRVEGVAVQSDNWTEYAERVAGWRAATAAPAIVRDILLADRRPVGRAPAPVVRRSPAVRRRRVDRRHRALSQRGPPTSSPAGTSGRPTSRRDRWIC